MSAAGSAGRMSQVIPRGSGISGRHRHVIIAGHIRDKRTKQPVEGAKVTLVLGDGDREIARLGTDKDGSLPQTEISDAYIDQSSTIRVEHPDYRPQSIVKTLSESLFVDLELDPWLDLMEHLPGIFREQAVDSELGRAFRRDERQADGEQTSDPLRAIVRLYEEDSVFRAEQTLRELPRSFDADQATYAPGWPIADFLGMLAHWVALEAEDVAMYGEPGRAWAERKLRFLVKNAAALHAARGTPHGLRYILEVFCDADVEVLEWTWPQGFHVGVASSIGVDTFLTGQPDVAHCSTVIWKTPLPPGDDQDVVWLETPCRSALGERRILNRLRTGPEARTASVLDTRLTRMKRLLTLESPAHTASYLALEQAEAPPPPEAAVFVVGLTSTAGNVWIETVG